MVRPDFDFKDPVEEDRYFRKVMESKFRKSQIVTAIIVTINLLLLMANLAVSILRTR